MTTWNAADKVGVALSGGDLIATDTGNSPTDGARSTTSSSSGKVAFSVTSASSFAAGEAAVGVSLAGAPFDASDADCYILVYVSGLGYLVANNGGTAAGPDTTSTPPTGAGDVVLTLLDSAGKLYFQCNGNNLFGADPVAGTGGLTIPTGSWFATIATNVTGATGTADFTPGSLPSGYSDWDGGGAFSVAANGGTYTLTGASVALDLEPNWTFVGKSEAAVDASGDYTLSEPTGAQQDDILVVDIAIRSNVLHTNGDWTFPQSDSSGNTTNNTTSSIVSYQTGYCIRGGSAPSYVFAKTGGSRCLGTVRAYRSSRAGTPVFDTSAEVAMGAASGTVTLSGGVSTAEVGELLVTGVFGARANTVSNMDGTTEVTGNSGATDTTTPPVRGTWTERSDRSNGTSPTVALACYDAVKISAGSTGDLTATESQSARHGMTVMAFKHPPGTSNKTIAADGGTYSLTGATVATKLGRKVAASGGTYAVTGASVTLRRNLPVVVGGGSYDITGTAVTLREDRKVSATGGTYDLTGSAVTVRHGYSVAVGAGSYALTGASVGLLKTWLASAASGSYALSGAAVTVRQGFAVSVGSGSYSLNGSDVTLTLASNKTVAAGSGSYSLSGSSVAVLYGLKVAAASGSYSLTGASIALNHGYAVSVDAGSYALNGSAVPLLKTWRLDGGGGNYELTGSDVTLTRTTAGSIGADSGSYALTGSSLALTHSWVVGAGSASYALTGSGVGLRHDWNVSVDFGSYVLTGNGVDLIRVGASFIDAGAGEYTLSGTSVALNRSEQDDGSSGGGRARGKRKKPREDFVAYREYYDEPRRRKKAENDSRLSAPSLPAAMVQPKGLTNTETKKEFKPIPFQTGLADLTLLSSISSEDDAIALLLLD